MCRGISCWLLVVSAAAAPASAHTGVLGAMAPFLDQGALVGGSTTWGIVLEDDGVFYRVCDEAPAMGAWFHLKVGERVLVGGGPGLLATDDRGCSYAARSLAGATDATAAVLAGGVVLVATGRPGFPNGVFASGDGGLTFQPTTLGGTASPLTALAASPSGSLVVVSGDDLDAERPLLLATNDLGASWRSGAVELSGYARAQVLSVNAAGDEVLVAADEADGTAWLLALDGALAEQARLSSPRPLTHAVSKDGAVLAVADTEALLTRAASGGPFTASDVLARCLFLVDDTLWACGATLGPLAGVHFATSSDGVVWLPQLFDADIRERACPEGSAGHDACVRYQDAGPLPDAGADAGAVDAGSAQQDAGPVDADDGGARDAGAPETPRPAPSCAGCASSDGGPWLWCALLLSARRGCSRTRRGRR